MKVRPVEADLFHTSRQRDKQTDMTKLTVDSVIANTSNSMALIMQQDATEYSLLISTNCSTCFGWYLHPSSGAHNPLSTVSGINETCNATCRESGWAGTEFLPSHVH